MIDQLIEKLFKERWSGDLANGTLDDMKNQLHKTLSDQMAGYWSGHTAYHIAVDGGFLIDSKRKHLKGSNAREGKKLTELGVLFMESMVDVK